MKEGDEGDSLYFVLSGRMVATRSKGTGGAQGLVLAGGAPRALHTWAFFKAIKEYDILFDYAGGTSVGALMAATIAFNKPVDETIQQIRKAIKYRPSADLSFSYI